MGSVDLRHCKRSYCYCRFFSGASEVRFSALVQLARLRKTRTGDINAPFNKAMKGKIGKMDRNELRATEID